MAALSDRSGTPYRASGKKTLPWTERYVVPHLPGNITAAELMGLRHGLIHTYTPVSDDSRKGSTREVALVNTAKAREEYLPRLEALYRADPTLKDHALLSCEELTKAISTGIRICGQEIEADSEWTKSFLTHAEQQFSRLNIHRD